MEIINLQQLIVEKNFNELVKRCSEIVNSNNISEITIIYKKLISLQSEVPEKVFYSLWKFFHVNGKLKLSNECGEVYFKKICKNKKISKMEDFVKELKLIGISKEKTEKYSLIINSILGDRKAYLEIDEKEYISDWHADYWGDKREGIKKEILEMQKYNIDKVKAIYEYILKYGYDEEVLLLIKDKILTEESFQQKYLSLMKMKYDKNEIKTNQNKATNILKIDYDQLAYELISGQKENLTSEENRVVKSIAFLTKEELQEKGKEMLVAFRFLEMHEVVITLASKLEEIFKEEKDKAGIMFLKVQTQIESGKYYEAQETLDYVLTTIALINEEKIAFLNLKKQICGLTKNELGFKQIEAEIKKLEEIIKTKEQVVL